MNFKQLRTIRDRLTFFRKQLKEQKEYAKILEGRLRAHQDLDNTSFYFETIQKLNTTVYRINENRLVINVIQGIMKDLK